MNLFDQLEKDRKELRNKRSAYVGVRQKISVSADAEREQALLDYHARIDRIRVNEERSIAAVDEMIAGLSQLVGRDVQESTTEAVE